MKWLAFCIFFLPCFSIGCAHSRSTALYELTAAYRECKPPAQIARLPEAAYSSDPGRGRYEVFIALKKRVEEEGRNAIPFIKELLSERDDDLCILGCTTAAKIKDKSFVEPLLVLLTDKNLDVSAHASYALVEMGKEHKSVSEAVLTKLRLQRKDTLGYTPFVWYKIRCIYILRKLNVKEAIPDIITALSDGSQQVRSAAMDALGELGAKEAIPQILSLLRSKNEKPPVRFRSAIVLGDLDAIEAVDDLIAALKDEAEDIRWGAAMAFKKIKSPKAIPALIDTITDKSQKVSAEAIRALYFQTGHEITADFLRKDTERKEAQDKWRAWWDQNRNQ